MNITELKLALPALIKNRIVPFIWGSQGVGKTTIIKQYCKDLSIGCIVLNPATQEVGDLIGLLIKNKDGTVQHARPEWFPTEGKGIVYVDEANRAHPDVIQALFSLPTERRIHRHILPDGWDLVFAGNYQTNDFNVTDTSDNAWVSRFCHIDFKPSTEEFVYYADELGAHDVASFISTHPELLEIKPKETLDAKMVTPDRRSWLDMIGRLDKEDSIDSIRFALYSGIVGATAAASYLSFRAKRHDRLSGRDILNQFTLFKNQVEKFSNTKETRYDILNSALEEIFVHLSKHNLNESQMVNFKNFILTVPAELGLKIMKKLPDLNWSQKNELLNNKDFVKQFSKEKLSK